MEIRIGCSLRYIHFKDLSEPFKFRSSSIVQGGEQLDAEFFNQFIVDHVGQVLMREYINYPYIKEVRNAESLDEVATLINLYFSRYNHFLNCLWFVKDNSVDIGTIFVLFDDNPKKLLIKQKGAPYSNSSGGYEESSISIKDLEIASLAFERIAQIQSPSPPISYKYEGIARPKVHDTAFHYKKYNDNNRIERALSFLAMARSTSFLPLKIALYVAVLECLFTTDKTEVIHKVCERVAQYLGKDFNERQQLFDQVKVAYDVRSGFFHGQTIDKKHVAREKLIVHSQNIDSILRSALTRIILLDFEVFNASEDELRAFFKRMLLN